MNIVWSPTALEQLDEIYDIISVVYEATDTTCSILGVMRCSRLIGSSDLA